MEGAKGIGWSAGKDEFLPHSAMLAQYIGWLRGSVVECRSLAGVLSLSCARPVADG